MNEQSNDVKGLRGAFTRAALAVFAFAVLTAWPLLADLDPAAQGQAQVASLAEQGDSFIQVDRSCRT